MTLVNVTVFYPLNKLSTQKLRYVLQYVYFILYYKRQFIYLLNLNYCQQINHEVFFSHYLQCFNFHVKKNTINPIFFDFRSFIPFKESVQNYISLCFSFSKNSYKHFNALQVSRKRSNIDSTDVFILDMGAKIFLWYGKGCNKDEKIKVL